MGRRRNAVTGLVVAGLVLWLVGCAGGPRHGDSQARLAKRVTDAGVVLPAYREGGAAYRTRVAPTAWGARIVLPRDPDAAWEVLQRALYRFGVPVVERDPRSRRLVTEWISLRYDPATGQVHTLPGVLGRLTLFKDLELERHRFALQVMDAPGGAVVAVRDARRQREVDIAPDSTAALLQWQDRPTQPEAAVAFLKRLQGSIESALVSRLVSPPGRPSDRAAGAQGPAREAERRRPPAGRTRMPAPGTPSGTAARPAVGAGDAPGMRTPPAGVPAAGPAPAPSPPGPAPRAGPGGAPATAGASGTRWLKVDAPPQAAFRAVELALAERGIAFQADAGAREILTDWLDYRYDSKRDLLRPAPEAGPQWAFNYKGQGRQRHRFRLQVHPGGAPGVSFVEARHVGFREQVDLTPDAMITQLSWQDRDPQGRIAEAFLRELRVIVGGPGTGR